MTVSTPGARLQQHPQGGDGKPPPGLLPSRLANMLWQLGGIGHRPTRAGSPTGALAHPAALIKRLVVHGVPHCPKKPREDLQREACAGLAIGRRSDVERGEVPPMRAGGLARSDLDKKQREGGHGIKTSLAPLRADILTDSEDDGRVQLGRPILLKLVHYRGAGRWHR